MPAWPSSLPTKALAGTHSMRSAPNTVVFKPDVGEPIRRRRYTGVSTTEGFELILTSIQVETLRTFWNFECSQGALSFTAPLIDGVLRTWWFDPEQPPAFTNIRGGTLYRVALAMGCRR
jgi:hypothetical protein